MMNLENDRQKGFCSQYITRTFLGRLRRVDLIISIWGSDVRPSVRTSVRPSVRPSAKSFSDSDEIWYVGRGRWVMYNAVNGMPYDPIQVQGQGHETFKVIRNSSIFKMYLLLHFNVSWQMTPDSETTEQYLTFVRSRCLILCPSFCVTWLWTWKGLRSVCTCFCYYKYHPRDRSL